jgi:glycosyltransferase involved in cell wall biosynthesis
MLVSCLCPTYNRAPNYLHLLSEALESFLRQCLPNGVDAELVILNDTPGQELVCTAPNVRVINTDSRFASLGEKRNFLCGAAQGHLLLVWDDDDISLPKRIAQAVQQSRILTTGLDRQHHYFNPQRSWWLDRDTLHWQHNHGYCHNASAFTRWAWAQVGGYPSTSGNEDALMDSKLRRAFGVNPAVERRQDWFSIYRWGVSPHHLSGNADGPAHDPHSLHYQRIGQKPIAAGTFNLAPAWNHDYQELCRRHCDT